MRRLSLASATLRLLVHLQLHRYGHRPPAEEAAVLSELDPESAVHMMRAALLPVPKPADAVIPPEKLARAAASSEPLRARAHPDQQQLYLHLRHQQKLSYMQRLRTLAHGELARGLRGEEQSPPTTAAKHRSQWDSAAALPMLAPGEATATAGRLASDELADGQLLPLRLCYWTKRRRLRRRAGC